MSRYGKQDEAVRISDLESSGSDADYDESGAASLAVRGGRRKKRGGRHGRSDYDDSNAVMSLRTGEGYSRSDCFNVEKMLLIFGYEFSCIGYSWEISSMGYIRLEAYKSAHCFSVEKILLIFGQEFSCIGYL